MYPKLIYLYTGTTNRIIDNQELHFSSDFQVEYDREKSEVTVTNVKNSYSTIYNYDYEGDTEDWKNKVIDLKLVVGRNGSGKSSILDMIGHPGFPSQLSFNESYEYFILYFLGMYQADSYAEFYIEGRFRAREYHYKMKIDGNNRWKIVLPPKSSDFQNINHCKNLRNPERTLFDPITVGLLREQPSEIWYNKESDFKTPHKDNTALYKHFCSSDIVGEETFVYAYLSTHTSRVKSYMDSHPKALTLHIQIKPRIYDDKKIRKEFYSLLYGKHVDSFIDWTGYRDCKTHFLIQYLETMLFQLIKHVLWRESDTLPEDTQRRNDTIQMLSKVQRDTENKVFTTLDKLSNRLSYKQKRIKYLKSYIDTLGNVTDKNNLFVTLSETKLVDTVVNGLLSLDESSFYELNSDYRVRMPIAQYQTANSDINADPIVLLLQELRMYRSRAGAEYKASLQDVLMISYEHLSYGELKFINFFASIYSVLNYVYGDLYAAGECEKIDQEITFVLLLDEPDANFHPEWSRLFIYNLVRELNSGLLSEYPCKYQIIITTHSPILLSDVPNNMISCINVDGSAGKRVRITDAPRGFMANITDIMKQSMFVDRTHGELATRFSLKLITDINSLRNQIEKKPDELKGNDTVERIQQLSKAVSLICDDVIRTRLENEILLIMQLYYVNNISGSERRFNQFQKILNEFSSLEGSNND